MWFWHVNELTKLVLHLFFLIVRIRNMSSRTSVGYTYSRLNTIGSTLLPLNLCKYFTLDLLYIEHPTTGFHRTTQWEIRVLDRMFCSTRELFLGVKWPGRGVSHPRPCIAQVKERVELYLYNPHPFWAFTAYSRVNFTFTREVCPTIKGPTMTSQTTCQASWLPRFTFAIWTTTAACDNIEGTVRIVFNASLVWVHSSSIEMG
jgi:hypothetical protein